MVLYYILLWYFAFWRIKLALWSEGGDSYSLITEVYTDRQEVVRLGKVETRECSVWTFREVRSNWDGSFASLILQLLHQYLNPVFFFLLLRLLRIKIHLASNFGSPIYGKAACLWLCSNQNKTELHTVKNNHPVG